MGGDIGSGIASASKQIGNLAGDVTGSNRLADVYGQMGQASLNQQTADRQQALGYAKSDQELQQLQQSITLNNQDISRKQALLASADPALIESGKQALSLLQGKSAASLKPLQDQRAQQRQQLQSSLAQQLGPDYATSSAGSAALNQFDQQTANTLTQAQQSAIGQYMGYATNAEQLGSVQSNIQNTNQTANQYGNIASRQIGAIEGNPINAEQQFQGQYQRYNAQNQTLQQLFQGGGSYAMSKFGGAGGGAAGAGGSSGSGMMAGGAGDLGGLGGLGAAAIA